MTGSTIISKVWNFANLLRDDGVGYGDHLEQITFLLFLKMADAGAACTLPSVPKLAIA